METLTELKLLYEAYLGQTEELLKKSNPIHGFFGIDRPGSHPCHKEFAQQAEMLLHEAGERNEPEEIEAILRFVLTTPAVNRGNEMAYWMFLAVQGMAVSLAEKLPQKTAEELLMYYNKAYPRNTRLPAQKLLAKRLKAAAK